MQRLFSKGFYCHRIRINVSHFPGDQYRVSLMRLKVSFPFLYTACDNLNAFINVVLHILPVFAISFLTSTDVRCEPQLLG